MWEHKTSWIIKLSMHIVNEHINTSLTLKRNYVNDVIFKMHCIHKIFVILK